jgi:hypothetical protein
VEPWRNLPNPRVGKILVNDRVQKDPD